MTDSAGINERSRWPHVLATALACTTFPLIWVGGLVTTYDAGMAVPDWPTTYGYNMFLYPWQSWISGPWDLFIEHGHRLLGALVGLLTIALNVAVWKYDARRWMRGLALLALVLVVAQGVLGGMRVRLASNQLARLHGCTGPLFFACTLVLWTTTSRFWYRASADERLAETGSLGAWGFLALAYLQLVVGSHLRHPEVTWAPMAFRLFVVFHLVLAILLTCKALAMAKKSWSLPPSLRRPACLCAVLVVAQVVLGVAAWRAKYGWPSFLPLLPEAEINGPAEVAVHQALAGGTVIAQSMAQAVTVTGHVAVGSLILAAGMSYALRLTRCGWLARRQRAAATSEGTNNTSCSALPSVLLGMIGVHALAKFASQSNILRNGSRGHLEVTLPFGHWSPHISGIGLHNISGIALHTSRALVSTNLGRFGGVYHSPSLGRVARYERGGASKGEEGPASGSTMTSKQTISNTLEQAVRCIRRIRLERSARTAADADAPSPKPRSSASTLPREGEDV